MQSPSQTISKVVEQVMQANAETKGETWKEQDIRTHINHAWAHMTMYDTVCSQEDHLAHAATRIAMALTLREAETKAWKMVADHETPLP